MYCSAVDDAPVNRLTSGRVMAAAHGCAHSAAQGVLSATSQAERLTAGEKVAFHNSRTTADEGEALSTTAGDELGHVADST